jgi:hypothetical protein
MFDLEKTIREWREQMISGGIKTPAPMEELENHLRAEIERQTARGMDARSSFENASRNIGSADLLTREFEKIRKEARAAREAQIVIAVSVFTVTGGALVMAGLLLLRAGSLSDLTAVQQLSSLVALALMCFFAFAGRLAYRLFPFVARKKMRDVICVSGAVLLSLWFVIFFWGILPRHDYMMGQLMLALVWCFMMPFGIFVGLVAGIETAARKKSLITSS